jgi:hypothetical protein
VLLPYKYLHLYNIYLILPPSLYYFIFPLHFPLHLIFLLLVLLLFLHSPPLSTSLYKKPPVTLFLCTQTILPTLSVSLSLNIFYLFSHFKCKSFQLHTSSSRSSSTPPLLYSLIHPKNRTTFFHLGSAPPPFQVRIKRLSWLLQLQLNRLSSRLSTRPM